MRIFQLQKNRIDDLLGSVDLPNEQINKSYLDSDTNEEVSKNHFEGETLYHSCVTLCLARLAERRDDVNPDSNVSAVEDLNSSHYDTAPKLKCPIFDPESLTQIKLSY